MNSTEFNLRERVKELNCLYELSRAAWEADNDVNAIITKTLEILPRAMQYRALAEVSIRIGTTDHETSGFSKCRSIISADISLNKKKYGKVAVGYRSGGLARKAAGFLNEEKKLIKAVARELSLFVKRASAEEEKERLRIQLQHVERLAFVGELSAGIAHELNEPLGKILGFAQLVRKAGRLNDQQSEDIERIVKASLYTREIIKKLMIFSRQMPRQVTKVNLNDVVGNILYFIDARFQSRGITMVRQLDESLPLLNADEVQMSQVLVNLITNAVHAMPNGGRITVETRKKGQFINLVVTDTGVGMSPDVRAKIFEPFFTTKPPGQGTGLGLSVVQGIVDSHNGRIKVSSAAGKGSRFEIQLPLKLKIRR